MQYSVLGTSGIKVSKICLGTMTWGQQNSEKEAHAQLDYALAQGVNFIDTAEMYPVPPTKETQGLTESYIGSWLSNGNNRDDIVLATKVAGPASWLPHMRGGPRLNREHIEQALDASLSRLKTDYIDLYQLHWPERHTNYFGVLGYSSGDEKGAVPIEETLSVIKRLLELGRIRHYGLSNETPWGLSECLRCAERLNMPAPVSIQNPYNLLNRLYEVGLAEFSHREQVGLLAYSPLAFGVLSGKYLNGNRPEAARLTLFDRFTRYTHDRAEAAVKDYVELAGRYGLSPVQLALGFVNSREFVCSNIVGATTLDQLAENIASIQVVLSSELIEELEALHRRHTFPCP